MRLAFTIPGVPVAKGRPKFSTRGRFVRAYTPSKTVAAEQTLAARAMRFRPPNPLDGPLHLAVDFVMPIPASWSAKKRREAEGGPHVTKPDLDNLIKLLKDALNGVFWLDDKQICSVVAVKWYGPIPETRVEIRRAVLLAPVLHSPPSDAGGVL